MKYQIKSVSKFVFVINGKVNRWSGLGLYNDKVGFVMFEGDNKPYTPIGGRKALESIINHKDGFKHNLHIKPSDKYIFKKDKLTKI